MKEIKLTRGMVALVDDADFDCLNQSKWHAQKACGTWYAVHKGKHKTYMHRLILGLSKGEIGDHVDGNGLNNRRSNLRASTSSQNASNRIRPSSINTSGYRGVCFDKHRQKWQVQIKQYGKFHHVGRFDDIAEAARAYDLAAKQMFGEFAGRPNIPESASQ